MAMDQAGQYSDTVMAMVLVLHDRKREGSQDPNLVLQPLLSPAYHTASG